MALRSLFGKSDDTQPTDGGPPVFESTHIRAVSINGVAVAEVLSEKYSEHEAKPLENELIRVAADHNNKLIIDMSRVTMLASAGIGSLITIHKACSGGKGKMTICAMDPNIFSMLKLTRLDKMLNFADDRDAALKSHR